MPRKNMSASIGRSVLVALVASLGLLHPQILPPEVVLFKGGRSLGSLGLLERRRLKAA